MLDTYVISQLGLWALWRVRRSDGGLGFPRKSNFAKDEGSGFWTPEMESAAYSMEKCVLALRSDLREAVIQEFTKIGTQRQKASDCHCCLSTYKSRLATAYRELLGYLNDVAAEVPLPRREMEAQNVEMTA